MASRRLHIALTAAVVAALLAIFAFVPRGDTTNERADAAASHGAVHASATAPIVPSDADHDLADWRSTTGDNAAQ